MISPIDSERLRDFRENFCPTCVEKKQVFIINQFIQCIAVNLQLHSRVQFPETLKTSL